MFVDAAEVLKELATVYALSALGINEDFQNIGTDVCRLFSIGSVANGLPIAVPFLASGICSGRYCIFSVYCIYRGSLSDIKSIYHNALNLL